MGGGRAEPEPSVPEGIDVRGDVEARDWSGLVGDRALAFRQPPAAPPQVQDVCVAADGERIERAAQRHPHLRRPLEFVFAKCARRVRAGEPRHQ